MASTVHCSIVSAELEIFSGMVEMVVASGTMGELGLFPGHTPLLSGVKPGPVRLRLAGGEEEIFFASGGYINEALAQNFSTPDDIDEAAAVEAQQKAERELADNRADIDFGRVSADLAEQAAMLRTIRKFREQR